MCSYKIFLIKKISVSPKPKRLKQNQLKYSLFLSNFLKLIIKTGAVQPLELAYISLFNYTVQMKKGGRAGHVFALAKKIKHLMRK